MRGEDASEAGGAEGCMATEGWVLAVAQCVVAAAGGVVAGVARAVVVVVAPLAPQAPYIHPFADSAYLLFKHKTS